MTEPKPPASVGINNLTQITVEKAHMHLNLPKYIVQVLFIIWPKWDPYLANERA